MNYHYPARTDEAWRRTRPEVFSFPERVDPDTGASIVFGGGDAPGIELVTMGEAVERLPHVVEGCERTGFENDFARFVSEQAESGFFVYVKPGYEAGGPVTLDIRLAGRDAVMKNLIVVAPGAEVSIVESMNDTGVDQVLYSNRLIVGADSKVSYKRLWRLRGNAYVDLDVIVSENAHLDLVGFCEGRATSKMEQRVELRERGGGMDELFVAKAYGKAHVDFSSNVHHLAPATTSRLEARSVVRGKGYSLHHGFMKVEREAAGADSYFASRNLLLTKNGRADSIPKLEIETDDVKAGHGATVSDVDEEAIYYLMTRGLPRREAEEMFIEGFLAPLYERFPELTLSGEERDVA